MAQSVPSSNAYLYEPLSVFHSLRTLELFAGGPSDLRRGRLRAHYNDPSVSYEILSYTWGNATLTHSIYIGDSVMPITTNLHSALVRLRYLDKPRVLWRDGICTNLKDNSERGKQVRHMGIFYQYAEQVIVYLGEASDGSYELLPLIKTTHSKVVPLPYGLPLPEVAFEQFGIPPAEDLVWRALRRLFLRPWWTRYWVIQEVIKGQQVIIMCGEPWDKFSTSIRAVDEHRLPLSFTTDMQHMEPVRSGLRQLSHLSTLRSTM
jgi:hypothetical protein